MYQNRRRLLLLAGLAAAAPVAARDPRRYEVLRRYLDADQEVREGLGLRRLRLGQPMALARRLWGRPREIAERRLFTASRWWAFRPDAATRVLLAGDERIERMRFEGTPASFFRTAQGARFGMPLAQVAALYGVAGQTRGDALLAYPERGVRFLFRRGLLAAFEIFPPRPR